MLCCPSTSITDVESYKDLFKIFITFSILISMIYLKESCMKLLAEKIRTEDWPVNSCLNNFKF